MTPKGKSEFMPGKPSPCVAHAYQPDLEPRTESLKEEVWREHIERLDGSLGKFLNEEYPAPKFPLEKPSLFVGLMPTESEAMEEYQKGDDQIIMEANNGFTGKILSPTAFRLSHAEPARVIIGISGKIGSGKDTAADVIREMRPAFQVKKFAGKLKQMASILTGIPAQDMESHEVKARFLPQFGMTLREILQKLGTDAVRHVIHDNAWIIATMSEMSEESKWIITDVRFPNEAKAIIDAGGYVIRIEREMDRGLEHISETALDGRYDLFTHLIVNNSSLEDFKSSVRSVFNNIMGD